MHVFFLAWSEYVLRTFSVRSIFSAFVRDQATWISGLVSCCQAFGYKRRLVKYSSLSVEAVVSLLASH